MLGSENVLFLPSINNFITCCLPHNFVHIKSYSRQQCVTTRYHQVNILSLADTYSHSRTRKVLHVQHCEPILKGLDKTSTRFLYFYCLHFNTFLFALEKRRICEIVSTVSFLHRPFIFWHQSCVVNCFDGSFYLAVAEKLCLQCLFLCFLELQVMQVKHCSKSQNESIMNTVKTLDNPKSTI